VSGTSTRHKIFYNYPPTIFSVTQAASVANGILGLFDACRWQRGHLKVSLKVIGSRCVVLFSQVENIVGDSYSSPAVSNSKMVDVRKRC
jgi:hypothetical protein